MHQTCIVKLEGFDGDDSFLHCGTESQEHLYAVIRLDLDGTARIVDNGYRTLAEAAEAWPEAVPSSAA